MDITAGTPMPKSWLYEDLINYIELKIQPVLGISTLLTLCIRVLVVIPAILLLAIIVIEQFIKLGLDELYITIKGMDSYR